MSDQDTPNPGEHHLCGDCRKCGKKPVVTDIVIQNGKQIEKQLCAECAQAQGMSSAGHTPINKLISSFVLSQSGAQQRRTAGSVGRVCDECGLSFDEFRKSGLLGCAGCYKAFEKLLGPLLERAHAGGGHHVGKVPKRAGTSTDRQARIALLRKQLDEAIMAEEYERAAAVRDQLQTFEDGNSDHPGRPGDIP